MVPYRTLNMATQGREPRQGDPSRGRSSCGVPIAVAENLRQIRPRLAVAGVVLEGRAVPADRVVVPALVVPDDADVEAGGRIHCIDLQHCLVASDRLVQPPQVLKRAAFLAPRDAFGIARIDRDRPVIPLDRVLVPPVVAQRVALVDERPDGTGILRQGPVETLDCRVEITPLSGGVAPGGPGPRPPP